MHLPKVTLLHKKYPTNERYPFSLPLFRETESISFTSPVTFFVGENGTGKSTLLEAIARRCDIYIWRGPQRIRSETNPYEELLYKFIEVKWTKGKVPGSFLAAEVFRNFAQNLDEWAYLDPGVLEYFGGKSLLSQSHGQSLLSFFKARYRIKGLYLLDEPESALSATSLLVLLNILRNMSQAGHAQFIVATHSPILMACPGAQLLSFDRVPVREIGYEETRHYQIYRQFMEDPRRFLDTTGADASPDQPACTPFKA
ncbi:AAA family ATPase [Thermodesulfobacteriota bacterium]